MEIVFWGASGQAKVMREIVEAHGHRLVLVIDSDRRVLSPFTDVPLRYGEDAFEEWARAWNVRGVGCLATIGGARGADRLARQRFMQEHGVKPIIAVHRSACVAPNATLGAGCQVLALSAVCADAKLGEACIVNTAASVDHESDLGNGVHIGPGATLCGLVTVGESSFVGAGATVLPRVSIGRNAIIGAGSVVTRDVPDNCVVYGNPARVKRKA